MTDEQRQLHQHQQRAPTSQHQGEQQQQPEESKEEPNQQQQQQVAATGVQRLPLDDGGARGAAQGQHRPLVRQLSAPTRLKAPPRQPPESQQRRLGAQMESRRSSADSDLERQNLRRHLHMSREQRHRHSHDGFERNYLHQERERRRLRHANPDQKSVDSPNSSASDSAFSQSQTTLESEGEQSIKGSARSTFSSCARCNVRKADNLHGDDDDDEDDDDDHHLCRRCSKGRKLSSHEYEDSAEQFKIVWRNLSYRVPDKRFSRLSACAGRLKSRLWPDEQQVPDELARMPEGSAGDAAGMPMSAPRLGKPRKVIFSKLNGCVRSGQLTAILGPSGAGKTTFLKCLTSSIVRGVSGSIDLIDGPTDTSHLKLCIIPQKGKWPTPPPPT